jgi:phage gpG-like protein
MSQKFEDAIKISLEAYAKKRANLTKVLGNEATNHFKDSWRKQGWQDTTISYWKARKAKVYTGGGKTNRAGTATKLNLTASGKKSIGKAILVQTGRLKRSFYMSVESQNRVIVVNPTPYSVYHNYGNPSRNLPQRKFMGKSQTLDEKSGVLISRMIKSALR